MYGPKYIISGIRVSFVVFFFLCGSSIYAYEWPIPPQDQQHWITGTYGECRGDRDHFHGRIDIDDAQQNLDVINLEYAKVVEVYSTPGGGETVKMYNENEGHTFYYSHVDNFPDEFRPISGGSTIHIDAGVVIGKMNTQTSGCTHLHLTDGDLSKEIQYNPLDFISPNSDNVSPTIDYVKIFENESTTEITGDISMGDCVDVVVKVHDGYPEAGSNNGIYSIDCWIEGPEYFYQSFQGYSFDSRASESDWNINYVYAKGSQTGTNIYKATNYEWGDNYWATDGLPEGTYTITVEVKDINGNSVEKSIQRYLTPETPVEPPQPWPPSQPTNLTANTESDFVHLIWSPSSNAAGYYVYRSIESGFIPSPSNRIATVLYRYYNDSNITTGVKYYYKVSAYNDYGESYYSNEAGPVSYVSGTIAANTTWSGQVYIAGSVVVDNNSTLTILPGTTVKFGGYYNHTAKAGSKIIAEGTESNPILFTSTTGTSRQSWKNIYIYSSHNRFKWCTFEYGNWALKVEGYPDFATDNVIQNCTFHDNDQALRIHKNTATVKNCNIYNNRHGLVCCNNTEVDFTGNHIYNNDRDGVYTWSGNHLNFLRNVIENNGLGHSSTCNGIYTTFSDVILLDPGNSSGKNTIRDNYDCEIKAYYGSPTVEIGNPVLGGDNAIYDDTGYEIYNYSGNPKIWACHSWWGEYPPNSSRFYGSVNYSYPLSSEPSWVGSTTGGMGKVIAYGSDPSDLKEKIKNLKDTIDKKSDSKEAEEALFELYAIIRADFVEDKFGEKKNFYGYLGKIFNNHRAKRLGKIALEKMIIWKMLESDNNNAIKLSKQALKILSGEDRMSVLENLTMLYIERAQINKARACLDECKEKYSFDQAGIEMIEEELNDAESQIKEGILKPVISDEELAESSTSIPASFNLSQNYPNPGNPTTTIRFQLPQSRHVVLKIFNVLGQEIKTLVDDYREAGTYSVIWDGRNNQGIEMPSGIYLYVLKVGDKVFTKKLTLLK